ncbi:hypothetical protein F2Q69_00024417 [Brassica cretica]|uniref:Uncharacterized protein n=1 Tax=Brassica cretica TaxID=69181 RepID=A0A8S9Q1R0_BRACR|nr:hypothetical protein F2Q69_00024417 [Brassica cretica]
MIESDDQSILTGSDDNPVVEESLVVSDEFVTEIVMKPDSLSESLESFTSDFRIFDIAGQKEDQNTDDKEENMSFSLGEKREHTMVKQSQKIFVESMSRVFLSLPNGYEDASETYVYSLGGLLANLVSLSCLDKYLCHDLNLKAHETYLQKFTARCIPLAKETSQWTEKENIFLDVLGKKSFNTLYLKDNHEDECEPKECWFGNQRMQVVQKRPHKIRTSKDKNNDVLTTSLGRKLKSTEADFNKGNNSPLQDDKAMIALAMEEYVVITVADENTLVNKLKVVGLPKLARAIQISRRLLVASLPQLPLAVMKFYLKHKWRFWIFLSKKKVEMSTEELLRTSTSQNSLLNASVSNLLTKQSQNCSFFEFFVQWKWYPPEQSYQAFSVWFLRLWTWQKKRQVLRIKIVLVVSHHLQEIKELL